MKVDVMNDDLISRSALKIAIREATYDFTEIPIRVDRVIALIDNSPSMDAKKIVFCKDCKHQKKFWHEDKRMKEKGYWIFWCDLIDDSFIGTPVWGEDNQFCSSAVKKD